MRKVVIAAFIFVSIFDNSLSIYGQENSIEKLKSDIATSPDSIKIDLLNEIGWRYRNNFPDSTIYYANRALELASRSAFVKRRPQSLNYIGVAHRNLSNYSKAFEYYLEAFKVADENNFLEQKGYALVNLGNLSIYQSDFDGALSYFKRALATAEQLGDKSMIAYCYLNIGRAHRNSGDYVNAEKELMRCLELRHQLSDIQGAITIESDLGEVYRLQGNFRKSLEFFEKSIDKARPLNLVGAVVYGLNNIALIYLDMGEVQKAKGKAMESLELAESTGLKNDVRKAMLTLSKIAEIEKDYQAALGFHKDYFELDRQIFSEENVRKVERMRAQYENEKREAENSYLREQATLNEEIISRQRMVIALTGFGIFLLVIVAVISYYAFLIKYRLSKKIEAQKEKIEQDKKVIEGQAKKLEEIDRAKSRFFANISHDLRSPLSLILGNIENIKLEDDNYLSAKSLRDLDVIERNSKRLLYMTDEINDLTRLEEGKISLKLEPMLLTPYVELLVNMFHSAATFKGIALTFHSADPNVIVSIDPRQFEKIIYNLLSNAIKHSIEGNSIHVSVEQQSNKVNIVVADTGEGIHAQSLPYIFDRFYQAPEKKYHAREGLGIGLALVKELVELHQGLITVTSEQGKGTKFIVSMSLAEEGAIPNKPVRQTEYFSDRQELLSNTERIAYNSRRKVYLTESNSVKPTILIVEDHPEIRQFIRELIEQDYKILEAGDGKEALSILEKNEVDLIITDLMMPIMDGFELLETISNHERFNKMPVLVVSARSSEQDREKVLHTGFNDFLQKPFNKDELVLRVQNLLQQREKWDVENGKSIISQHVNQLESLERALMMKMDQFILEKIKDENLNVAKLADAMAASERQVYRLMKKMTKMTPNEYIREFKLQYANELIEKGKVKTASEAAREIGIKNVTQFNKNFETKYGLKASDLLVNDQK